MAKKINKKTKKKKTNKRAKRVILLIFLFLIIGLAILGGSYLFTDSKFNIKKIVIKNNKHYSSKEIIQIININDKTNIFKVTKYKLLNSLKQLPYIEDIKINRKLPNNMVITIKERTSKYLAHNKETGQYIRLSKDGIILEVVKRAEAKENEMLVFGINFDNDIKIGESIANLENKKLDFYMKVLKEYKKNKIEQEITSIKFKNDTISIILNYNLNVIFEEKDLDYDMSIFNEILKEIQGQTGTVDMTKPDPIFINNIN